MKTGQKSIALTISHNIQRSEARFVRTDGAVWIFNFITPRILRIRFAADGRLAPSALLRYGFIRNDLPPVPMMVNKAGNMARVQSKECKVELDGKSGRISFYHQGKALLREIKPCQSRSEQGFRVRFKLPSDTAFFGLGDQSHERIEHRGTKALMWVENLLAYAPVPFLLTNKGYGLVVNTTRKHIFDLGSTSSEWFGFDSRQGTLDYYFIYGGDPAGLIDQYSLLAGRPPMPPKWTFGLWFVSNQRANAREWLDDCLRFRERGFPCDAIGLEPGWTEKHYDYSVTKRFDPQRFYMLPWFRDAPKAGEKQRALNAHNVDHNRNREQYTFIDAVRSLGFKPGLWLCNDYDLSYEAERQISKRNPQADPELKRQEGNSAAMDQFFDEHLSRGKLCDQLTRPEEPWFQHLKKFVDLGIEYFKMDGACQTLEHPDRLFGNGMKDDEMHNLYPLLYAEQMSRGFREQTGRRSAIMTVNGWLGLQRFPGTWAGDIGGREKPLIGNLNLAMCGHSYLSCDMDNLSADGIHCGFLMPWAQINSWAHWRHPWWLSPELQKVFRFYARLRYQLIPYLYAQAYQAYQSGLPIMRPLPLVFPQDPRTYRTTNEYMLGDNLLVTVFNERIYLPEGEWTDYWTGKRHVGPISLTYNPPSQRGGGLFARQGAIIPMSPPMDYVGQIPETEMTLDIYPHADGQCMIYEDDGATLEYEQGRCAITKVEMKRRDNKIQITIAPRKGLYAGMPKERRYVLKIHSRTTPVRVTANRHEIPHVACMEILHDKDGGSWFSASDKNLWIAPPTMACQIEITTAD